MRHIVHLDADAFFASVEQAADSRLRGKAIAVGGEQRGIIASASYEARRFGVYTPMPTSRARKLCPHLLVLPGDYEKYERFSQWMFTYAYDFTPNVEITSIDEGYFDLTGARRPAREVAETIRRAIYQALKLSVSEGVGSNKLVSQIASKLRKPAAVVQVLPGQERSFLNPLPNRWLPGIGPKTAVRMNAAGLTRIGQVAATPEDLLARLVGAGAPQLKLFANGEDQRPLVYARADAKSYSHQETFAQDQTSETFIEATLRKMADSLMSAVRGDGKMIRTLSVKVRYNDMAEQQCSESLAEPTDLETDLYGRLRPLLRKAWQRRVSLRMVSLKCANIYDSFNRSELPLHGTAHTYDTRRQLAGLVSELRKTYGRSAVMRGHDLVLRDRASTPPTTSPPPPRPTASFQPRPRTAPHRKTPVYAPLHVHSYYSFLDSTLSPAALVELAKQHGCPAIALTDQGNLHGAVPFMQAAREAGIKPVLGVAITVDEKPLLLYVENQRGYGNLCRILNRGNHQASFTGEAFRFDTTGLLAVGAEVRMAERFPGAFYLGVGRIRPGQRLDENHGLPRIAVPAVHYASPRERRRYDIVQSIRTLSLLDQHHPGKKYARAGPFLSPATMAAHFEEHPELVAHTLELAGRCSFDFVLGKLQFPAFPTPDGSSPHAFLRNLVLRGLQERYGANAPGVRPQVEEELSMISEVGYEEYFLVVWDLLQTCREQGIEWITRGSAADSLVCYCLGISDVCPIRFDLYFRRFLNRERMGMNKLPDIDVDFPHDRKDDVVDLVFKKYGPEHAAVVGGFSTYQGRSALGDVAKVLGVSEHQVRRVTTKLPHLRARDLQGAGQQVECGDLPLDEEPYRTAIEMAQFLDGFPRYPKMHPCGVVLSRAPMAELTPCFVSAKGYPTTHFDMDAVEDIGLVKLDLLAQAGLSTIRDVRAMLAERGIDLEMKKLEPWQDPKVWDMISGGQSRSVHHIESPAMISLCRMCNVRDIDTLIAVVSVIRPGAANQHKKHHFTLRYQGLEPITYPHPSTEPCLRCTYGMLVYEEQVLQICEAFAGMPGGEADQLRRALNKRNWEKIRELGKSFYRHACEKGRTLEEMKKVWKLVCGFHGYAFCKAHSTAYGVEAYQAAWLKCYYPVEFMAAVLTSGKGFYQTIVYILESLRLGATIRPPSVQRPGPGFRVEGQRSKVEGQRHALYRDREAISGTGSKVSGLNVESMPARGTPSTCDLQTCDLPIGDPPSIRVPVSVVKGLTERLGKRIVKERQRSAFTSLKDFYLRTSASREEMELLLRVGAFDDLRPCTRDRSAITMQGKPETSDLRPSTFDLRLPSPSRTALFWEIQGLHQALGRGHDPDQGRLLTGEEETDRVPNLELTEPTRQQRLEAEQELLGFTASGHPLELYHDLAWDTYCPVADLPRHVGKEVTCCGLIVQTRVVHYETGDPMKFLTLADWSGIVETEMFSGIYKYYGLATVRYPVLEVTAVVEGFDNRKGHTLRIIRAGKPRKKT